MFRRKSIGRKTALELTGGDYQFVVATHQDKGHLHNVRPDRVLSKVD
nr:relaxase/mobilization nuclease domain-containing protein [Streptococcus agalactiae]